MIHKIKHWLGWNTGEIFSVRTEQGTVIRCFMCDYCGELGSCAIEDN